MNRFLSTIVFLWASLFSYAQDENSGLVGHWIFDSTHISGNVVKDLAGNHDAIIEGKVNLYEPTGNIGLKLNPLEADRKTDAIVISNMISPSELPQKEISVETWFCVLGGTRWNGIIGCFEDKENVDKGWGWLLGFNDDFFFFALSSDGNNNEDGNVTYLHSNTFLTYGKWYHLVGAYDGLSQKIYVNGELHNSSNHQSGKINYAEGAPYVIGVYRDSNENRTSDGIILESKVYNRALNQEEIKINYKYNILYRTFPDVPTKTEKEASIPLSNSPPKAPGIWRFWTYIDGLFTNFCTGAWQGPTGNIIVSHGDESNDYFDGYKIYHFPNPMHYPLIHEQPEKFFWLMGVKEPELLQTYDFTKNKVNGEWKQYSISPPFSSSAFFQWFVPLDQFRILYISQDQRIMEFNTQTLSSTQIMNVADTNVGKAWGLSMGNDDRTVWVSGQNGLGKLTPDFGWEEHLLKGLNGPCIFEYEMDTGDVVGYLFNGTTEGNCILGEYTSFLFNGKKFLTHSIMYPLVSPKIDLVNRKPLVIRQKDQCYSIDGLGKDEYGLDELIVREENALWLSHNIGGVARYAPALWQTPRCLRHIDKKALAIREDRQGSLWVCYENGFSHFSDQKWTFHSSPSGWHPSYQFDIGVLPGGKFYYSCSAMIKGFDVATQQFNRLFKQQSTKRIPACFGQFSKDKLWITDGTSMGLFDGVNFEPVFDLSEIPFIHEKIESLAYLRFYFFNDIKKIKNGDIWVATRDGIDRIRNGKLVPFVESQKLHVMWIKRILELEDNTIYANSGSAIYQFDGDRWTVLQKGFYIINTMKQFKDESVWVGACDGLHRFYNGSWSSFNIEDGLPSNQIWDLLEDSEGRIWAATSKGVSLYHPDSDPDSPDTYVIDQGKRVYENSIIEEVAPDGNIRIEFTGMDKWKYTEVDRLLYSYRLDEDEWSPYSSQTIASITGVSPGIHRFQVKAMDRNWNKDLTPAVWNFMVILPWYKQPIFIISLAGSVLMILFLLILHLLRYINQEKIIAKRTYDLSQAHVELQTYQQQLRSLASKMSIMEERSKREIAFKIHDRIGHTLALCQMRIESLQKEEWVKYDDDNRLTEVRQTVKQIIEETRDLTVEISPPILYELGLEQTLRWLIEQMN